MSQYSKSIIGNEKQFQSLDQFLNEMFTDQFVKFTERVKRLNLVNKIDSAFDSEL